jgi:hypothetical protein
MRRTTKKVARASQSSDQELNLGTQTTVLSPPPELWCISDLLHLHYWHIRTRKYPRTLIKYSYYVTNWTTKELLFDSLLRQSLFFLPRNEDRLWNTVSYLKCTGGAPFQGANLSVREADHSLPVRTKVKNVRSHTSPQPHVFVAWGSITDRDSFTSTNVRQQQLACIWIEKTESDTTVSLRNCLEMIQYCTVYNNTELPPASLDTCSLFCRRKVAECLNPCNSAGF